MIRRRRYHGKLTEFDRRLVQMGYAYGGAALGVRVYECVNETAGRRVDVQIWPDGQHRASNGLGHGSFWRWSTLPTPFTDITGMAAALEHEWQRADHPAEVEADIAARP